MKSTVLLLLITLGCSSSQSLVYYESDNVLDIEIPASQVKAYCSIPGDPEKKNYFILLYIFNEKKIINASYLHVVSKTACEKNVALLRDLIKKSHIIRVIGTSKTEGGKDTDLSILMDNPQISYVDSNWQLSRVISDRGCRDFLQRCSDPLDAERKLYGE